jgi:hypothetical protein
MLLQRRAGRARAQGYRAGRRQEIARRQVVVQEQAGADHPRGPLPWHPGRLRHQEAQRADDVRRALEQHFALGQRLAHEAEMVLLQIAQAAMDQLAGRGRRVLGQVVLFAQDDGQAAPGRVARDPGAVDAATHDEDVAIDTFYTLSHVHRAPVRRTPARPQPTIIRERRAVFGRINPAGVGLPAV